MIFSDVQEFLDKALNGATSVDADDAAEKVATNETSSAVSEDLIDFVDGALAESEQEVSSKVALAQLLIAGDVLAKGRF